MLVGLDVIAQTELQRTMCKATASSSIADSSAKLPLARPGARICACSASAQVAALLGAGLSCSAG